AFAKMVGRGELPRVLLDTRYVPRHHPPVAVRHHAMEGARVIVEHQRQELAVAVPERQLEDAVDLDPFERALRIGGERLAGISCYHEQETEPVLALLAEARPADRAAQLQFVAIDARFLVDLAAHAGNDVLV